MSASAAEKLQIAIALPLGGPHASIGSEIKAAIELAAHKAQTGALLPMFDIQWIDDKCSAAGGLAAAREITESSTSRPLAVIGHACPSAASAAAPIYERAGIIFIAAGSLPRRAPAEQRLGSKHFRLPADGLQSTAIADALMEAGAEARVALVRDRTQYSAATLDTVAAILKAQHRPVAMQETFAGAEKDFGAIARRLQAGNITHLALAAFASEAVLLVAEVRKVLPSVTIVAADQLADAEFARNAGSAAEGIRVALPPEFQTYSGAVGVARELTEQGVRPSRAALASFAAFEVLLAASSGLDRLDSEQVAQAIDKRSFQTILGNIGFDATGGANLPSHVLYTWTNGSLRAPPQ